MCEVRAAESAVPRPQCVLFVSRSCSRTPAGCKAALTSGAPRRATVAVRVVFVADCCPFEEAHMFAAAVYVRERRYAAQRSAILPRSSS